MTVCLRDVVAATPDPELPMVTIEDLGILQGVDETTAPAVVTITPTYSGCPAMREIAADIRHRASDAGYADVEIRTQLAPAWSSDWITSTGRAKLHAAGIAPPVRAATRTAGPIPLTLTGGPSQACPRCGSPATQRIAAFSATACKSLHRCQSCGEPFEAIKPL